MILDNRETILNSLEKLMYGHNYEVYFGIETFESNENLDDCFRKIKNECASYRLDDPRIILSNEEEFWDKINYGFQYRGDDVAGLELTTEQEAELKIEQENYKDLLLQLMSNKTSFYVFHDNEYIPYWHLFWGYSFILFNDDLPSFFIYGGSSD